MFELQSHISGRRYISENMLTAVYATEYEQLGAVCVEDQPLGTVGTPQAMHQDHPCLAVAVNGSFP